VTVKARRRYTSELRANQAAATRERIVRAARTAFAEGGYGGTSIEEVARQAGVAVPTVYAAIGNKRELLRAVLLSVGERVDLHQKVAAILSSEDPFDQLRQVAALARQQWQDGRDFVRIVLRGRGSDPELEALYKEVDAERRRGEAPLVRQLELRGVLRSGLSIPEARDVLLLLSGPSLYEMLVVDHGWSPDRYEAWIAQTMVEALLEPATGE
jgi:AcrR family transcriptional regulator